MPLVRRFSVHVVQFVLQWGKHPIVVVKAEEAAWQKNQVNANNESVAPKKRKSLQDAKEDKQLDLLFRS